MPQHISEYWVDRIRTLRESEKLAPRAIRRRLAAEDPDGSLHSPSSEKTIARKLREFEALSDEDRRSYRPFSWPASMLEGSLPWEASRPLIGLLRHLEARGGKRPSVRLAGWYWRAYKSVPEAEPHILLGIAKQLEAWSAGAPPPTAVELADFEAIALDLLRKSDDSAAVRSAP